MFRALVDPANPGLRLLPYYTDTAAAMLFTQVLWPLLLVGAAFTGAALDTTRRRWLRLAAAAALLLPLAASAAGPVGRGMAWSRILDGPSAADLAALENRLEARVVPEGDAYLVAGRPPESGGERWITPADDALLFYLYAHRPTLFLYFLDHTARYGPAGLETTCAALQAGAGDTLLRTLRVRWALAAASAAQAVQTVGRRGLCGRTLREWFPAMRAAGSDGRLTIVEFWADCYNVTSRVGCLRRGVPGETGQAQRSATPGAAVLPAAPSTPVQRADAGFRVKCRRPAGYAAAGLGRLRNQPPRGGSRACPRPRHRLPRVRCRAQDLPGIAPGRFETLFCGHVLERLDNPGAIARRLLDAAHARRIARVVFVVPGHRGFQHDATHRQFVTRARFEREGLINPPGWRLREVLGVLSGNARWLGDYLTHRQLTVVHERVSA